MDEKNNTNASSTKATKVSSMTRRIIYGGIGFALLSLVVAGSVALLTRGSGDSDANSQNSANSIEIVEVSIENGEFLPATFIVWSGTTVRWVNNDSGPVQIASNPHPEHSDLPGLFAEQPFGPNDSYEYTFTEAGTYGYHNHLQPLMNGEIVVK